MALVTFNICREFYSMRCAEICITQVNYHFVQQIATAALRIGTCAATHIKSKTAHCFAQNIVHTSAATHIEMKRAITERIATRAKRVCPGRITTCKRRITKTVICRTLLRIFQDIKCIVDFFEFFFSVFITGVSVGMILHNQFMIRLFNICIRRIARDP